MACGIYGIMEFLCRGVFAREGTARGGGVGRDRSGKLEKSGPWWPEPDRIAVPRAGSYFFSSTLTTMGWRSTGPNVSTIDDTPAFGAPATTIWIASAEMISWTGVSWSSGGCCATASGWSAGSRQLVPPAIASLPAAASCR